jgi:predicted metal-dependent hydrolase
MTPEIIIAAITGLCSVVGVIITASASSKKLQQQLEVNQAVMNTKIENLTSEVRTHNGFAERIPVLQEQIKILTQRIEALEKENHHER